MAGENQHDQDQTTEDQDEAQAQADFDAGVSMETERPLTATETEGKPEQASEPVADAEDSPAPIRTPKYVRLTSEMYERLEAAAKRGEDSDKQLSKVFGTLGDLQKIVKSLQTSTPRGRPVEIPKEAFAAMERDFPELAAHTRAALEATLTGMTGTGSASAEVNSEELDRRVEQRVVRLQTEALEDAYPDWREIVGAVDITKGEKPDPNNAFRKWLSTQDKAYQAKVNGTNSAEVISRAIRAFQKATKPAQPANAGQSGAAARPDRFRDALRPRGDGGHPKGPNADDEFEAGFRTG